MFSKEKKKLTEEQIDVLVAIKDLVVEGKIPFAALEPVYKDFTWSKRIEDYIKEAKENEEKCQISCMKLEIANLRLCVKSTNQKLDKTNATISELRAELEEQRSKEGYARDENRIKNLLWLIFNNEESAKQIEDDLRKEGTELRSAEEKLSKKLEEKLSKELEEIRK